MSDLEPVAPVLLNTLKHHAGAVRDLIARLATASDHEGLKRHLLPLGNALMDLYTGPLSPRAVSLWVLDELARMGRPGPVAYREWLASSGGYATLTHPEGTAWVLRLGAEEARYVHLHPGRHSANTVRVRAATLRTAAAAHLLALSRGDDPMDRRLIDEARKGLLGLPPLGREPEGGVGVGAVIGLLRG
jgi:hypothetical protein